MKERHVIKWQVQSCFSSYLLCQDSPSPWESFMQHWNVLLALWNIVWVILGFHLYSMTQMYRMRKFWTAENFSFVCLQECKQSCCIHTIIWLNCNYKNSVRNFPLVYFPFFPMFVAVTSNNCTSVLLILLWSYLFNYIELIIIINLKVKYIKYFIYWLIPIIYCIYDIVKPFTN